VGRRLRMVLGLLALAELVVFVLVAGWIGVGWTILAILATSALGAALLGRQGTKALQDVRERARTRRPAGRELGNAGLVAIGGLLMLLPGFVTDLVGLLCLLPGTRDVIRALLLRTVYSRLPDRMRGPVRVDSTRTEYIDSTGSGATWQPGGGAARVIEGELEDPPAPHHSQARGGPLQEGR
jgi:UPF0716 protein FxsA